MKYEIRTKQNTNPRTRTNATKKGEFLVCRSGQVMFLTVMVLGVIISSVTVVAGLLMSYQVRRSADVSHSARAIAAADAGVECMLYQMFSVSVDNGVEAKN